MGSALDAWKARKNFTLAFLLAYQVREHPDKIKSSSHSNVSILRVLSHWATACSEPAEMAAKPICRWSSTCVSVISFMWNQMLSPPPIHKAMCKGHGTWGGVMCTCTGVPTLHYGCRALSCLPNLAPGLRIAIQNFYQTWTEDSLAMPVQQKTLLAMPVQQKDVILRKLALRNKKSHHNSFRYKWVKQTMAHCTGVVNVCWMDLFQRSLK